MQKLNGPFKDIIPILVKMKKSIGYKYDNINIYVTLDNFLYENNITEIKNDKEIFLTAIKNEKNENVKSRRYSALININAVLNSLGLKEVNLENVHFNSKEKFIPKILEDKEIKKFFETIDILSKNYNSKEQNIYQIFFRLLYSTGLRISEALNLEKRCYIRENGVLLIIKSKNYITRNVCLSDSMKKILDEYLDKINIEEKDKIFNISEKKIREFFCNVVITASLEPLRIHDLRHTFAVSALNKLLKDIEENKALYMLQVFMGHTKLESTEYYLRFTKKEINNFRKTANRINNDIFVGEKNERNR